METKEKQVSFGCTYVGIPLGSAHVDYSRLSGASQKFLVQLQTVLTEGEPVSSWQLSLINNSTNLVIVGQEVGYEYYYQAMNTLISVVHIESENKDSTCIYTGGCHGDCTTPTRLDATNRCLCA